MPLRSRRWEEKRRWVGFKYRTFELYLPIQLFGFSLPLLPEHLPPHDHALARLSLDGGPDIRKRLLPLRDEVLPEEAQLGALALVRWEALREPFVCDNGLEGRGPEEIVLQDLGLGGRHDVCER